MSAKRDWGVAVVVSETTLAVADEVAGENHKVTDVDVEAAREASDRVPDADRTISDTVAVPRVAAAVGVVRSSSATKRTALVSATRTPQVPSVALQCHLAPHALPKLAVSASRTHLTLRPL
jgi:hypothetical protein